jgi:hypothetical protein
MNAVIGLLTGLIGIFFILSAFGVLASGSHNGGGDGALGILFGGAAFWMLGQNRSNGGDTGMKKEKWHKKETVTEERVVTDADQKESKVVTKKTVTEEKTTEDE